MSHPLSLFRVYSVFRIQSASFIFRPRQPFSPSTTLALFQSILWPSTMAWFAATDRSALSSHASGRCSATLPARRPARLTNVRCFAVSAIGSVNHSHVFLWITWILEAVVKRPFPLARSSYHVNTVWAKNALGSLCGFVDERYQNGRGIRVVLFALNCSLLSFLTAQTRKLLVNERFRKSVLSVVCSSQLRGLLGAPGHDRGCSWKKSAGGAASGTRRVIRIKRQVAPSVDVFEGHWYRISY